MELNPADYTLYFWGINYSVSENKTLTEYTSFSFTNSNFIQEMYLTPGIIIVIVYDTSKSAYYLLPAFDIRVYANPFYSIVVNSYTDTNLYYILNPNTTYINVGYLKDITDSVNTSCTIGESDSCGDGYITIGATSGSSSTDSILIEESYCICVDKSVFDIYSSYGPGGGGSGSGSGSGSNSNDGNTINQKTIYVIGIILIILIIIVVVIIVILYMKSKKKDNVSTEEIES